MIQIPAFDSYDIKAIMDLVQDKCWRVDIICDDQEWTAVLRMLSNNGKILGYLKSSLSVIKCSVFCPPFFISVICMKGNHGQTAFLQRLPVLSPFHETSFNRDNSSCQLFPWPQREHSPTFFRTKTAATWAPLPARYWDRIVFSKLTAVATAVSTDGCQLD